ncbi:MAG: hypothetical protein IJQ44_09040 [Bacteroidaceae bacterium]|jgi:negative regulator of sigma E activity|nr:hypothetical protein [Bacteroidaceae bacterium]
MKQFDPIKHKNSQPFSTPEGYFEDFTQRMMARIATEEKAKEERVTAEAAQPSAQQTAKVISLFSRTSKFVKYAVAAALAGVVFGTSAYFFSRQSQDMDYLLTAMQEENMDENYINDVLDYEMVNNQEIAYYLTEAY